MDIALIGWSGTVGRVVLAEFERRSIEVLCLSRNSQANQPDQTLNTHKNVDVYDVESLTTALDGISTVISCFNPGWDIGPMSKKYIEGTKSIVEATNTSPVDRLIWAGGSGSLYVAEGVQFIDSFLFPKQFYDAAHGPRAALQMLQEYSTKDWVYFSSPPDWDETAGRTGTYRTGGDDLSLTPDYLSFPLTSIEDYAVAIVDEASSPKYSQQRVSIIPKTF